MSLWFRRRFASWVLALVALQVASVVAAPLSSCCASPQHATPEAEPDCCPAGAHAPGECPLHARKASAACRLACDAPHGLQFLIGAVGVMPPHNMVTVPISDEPLVALAAPQSVTLAPVPDSPPPRSF